MAGATFRSGETPVVPPFLATSPPRSTPRTGGRGSVPTDNPRNDSELNGPEPLCPVLDGVNRRWVESELSVVRTAVGAQPGAGRTGGWCGVGGLCIEREERRFGDRPRWGIGPRGSRTGVRSTPATPASPSRSGTRRWRPPGRRRGVERVPGDRHDAGALCGTLRRAHRPGRGERGVPASAPSPVRVSVGLRIRPDRWLRTPTARPGGSSGSGTIHR